LRGIQRQSACKPGSVHMEFHAVWPFIWDVRCRTPHATHPGDSRETSLGAFRRTAPVAPIRSCSRWGLPCRCHCWPRGALLPHPFTLTPQSGAVCFLWHFPWGHPRRALPGTVFPWSPDFPPPPGFRHWTGAAIRPTGTPSLTHDDGCDNRRFWRGQASHCREAQHGPPAAVQELPGSSDRPRHRRGQDGSDAGRPSPHRGSGRRSGR
jgi:hypothetical protein